MERAMANKENIRKLIELLENTSDENFGMDAWCKASHCGTVACIAGWASTLINDDYWLELKSENIIKHGDMVIPHWNKEFQDWFGLSEGHLRYLFTGLWSSKPLGDITKHEAINKLKTYL